ncbi:hypothetical protein [Streptomyces chrestomyceticus]|uniref:hypothetical protein n=1 Tax=Streptomyces chrestomyceticus TaxID=68185 RepID=UPI0037A36545
MAVINLMILEGDEQEPEGWTKISKDLNAGAGGEYIYAAYTRSSEQGSPINSLDVALTDNRDYQPPKPWERYDKDLNAGAGGKFVYLLHI